MLSSSLMNICIKWKPATRGIISGLTILFVAVTTLLSFGFSFVPPIDNPANTAPAMQNGGIVACNVNGQVIARNIDAGNSGSIVVSLKNHASLTGSINTANVAATATLSIDASSTWTVTGTSYLTAISNPDGISGNKIINIVGNGNNVYYDAGNSANSVLGGNTFTLVNGGTLAPKGASVVAKETFFPATWELNQNYPNPFNPSTTFSFSLQEASGVTLKIYDMLGKEVATIVNDQFSAGTYSYNWNAGSLASGTYIYRIIAVPQNGGNKKSFSESKKFILMK
jgi:hypothetical protein